MVKDNWAWSNVKYSLAFVRPLALGIRSLHSCYERHARINVAIMGRVVDQGTELTPQPLPQISFRKRERK